MTLEQCLSAGADGVYDLPIEDYHALDGVSGSKVHFLELSNMHYDNARLFFQKTKALTFGNLVHCATLEPDELDKRYAVVPVFDSKSKTGRTIAESNENFRIDNADKIIVTDVDYRKAQRMARNIRAIYGDILDGGIKERSLFVDYDGVVIKSRLDIDIEDEGSDVDIKTITLGVKPYNLDTLEATIRKFRYDLSAALRNIVRRELGKPVGKSFLLFCDTGNGHVPRKIQIHPDWIKDAEKKVEDLLDKRRDFLLLGWDSVGSEVIDDRTRNQTA